MDRGQENKIAITQIIQPEHNDADDNEWIFLNHCLGRWSHAAEGKRGGAGAPSGHGKWGRGCWESMTR